MSSHQELQARASDLWEISLFGKGLVRTAFLTNSWIRSTGAEGREKVQGTQAGL